MWLAANVAFETAERAARQVDQHLRLGFVHRQREAEAADAALVAERLRQSAVPSAIAQSSMLWCASISRSPSQLSTRLNPPCAATWSSMWS